jgi:protein tyrosine/serine phosphatase
MKNRKSPLYGFVFILAIAAAAILLVKHFHIADFRVVKPGVLYTSGQPHGMDYTRMLYRYHLATIVNIRPVSEHREQNWYNEEIIWTKNNGVNYIELPIEKKKYFPDKETQDKFLAIMADKNKLPVLLHGGSDDKRVAMLAAVWLEKGQGQSVEETTKIIRKIIDDRKLTEAEIEFIRNLAK